MKSEEKRAASWSDLLFDGELTKLLKKGRVGSQSATFFCLNFTNGCGSKIEAQGYAGFSLLSHFPGFHFGPLFATHGQIVPNV